MADWAAFASVAGVVTFLVLLLAHASQSLLSGGHETTTDATASADACQGFPSSEGVDGRSSSDGVDWSPSAEGVDGPPSAAEVKGPPSTEGADGPRSTEGVEELTTHESSVPDDADPRAHDLPERPTEHATQSRSSTDPVSLPPVTLLLNVAATQGFFALFLLGGVWYAQVPFSALGVGWPSPSEAALGVGLGVVLFGANQAATSAGRRFGVGGGEELRAALAPESLAGWALLLFVALPVVSGFEELLFRGALIGGLGTGFSLSLWLLAVLSSGAFALGHGAQGRAGIVVTGVLGFVFAAAFVLTGSLFVVIVAHYLVNALEFIVHEGPGRFW